LFHFFWETKIITRKLRWAFQRKFRNQTQIVFTKKNKTTNEQVIRIFKKSVLFKSNSPWVSTTLWTILALYIFSKFILPTPTFNHPTSTILLDVNGQLLGARIATDEQWRFPELDTLPIPAKQCIIQFEDKYFEKHLGINPISIGRAICVNIKANCIKQGGSTLTMQLSRLWFKNKKRTILQKLLELAVTIHLEINYSKEEILNLYMSHAPFGGNVVGYEAAAWRYYARQPKDLSWAEHAALAVLPNAPAVIYPGKNSSVFRLKRNRLLDQLLTQHIIDSATCALSKLETLPGTPLPLPNYTNHLVDKAAQMYPGERVSSHIEYGLQQSTQKIINTYVTQYAFNNIHNAAAIILETKTGHIIGYVGNATQAGNHNNQVDIIKAVRSTGSVLKPFLYTYMLSQGEVYPAMLVADIPTFYAGYAPQNYYQEFDGAVPINEALTRSLNIPFVRQLKKHGVDRLYHELENQGFHGLKYPSDHYGLSLILGGAEGSLLDITSMYAGMARTVMDAADMKVLDNQVFTSPYFDNAPQKIAFPTAQLHPGAVYTTLKTLQEVNRPISHEGWRSFNSSNPISWKTGTSFGNKDAWAIGTSPQYTIGVWVGNADGEGRAGLTGLNSAAPVLFDILQLLPTTSVFPEPLEYFKKEVICKESGRVANAYCPHTDTVSVPDVHYDLLPCRYHKWVHVDTDQKYQVHASCESVGNMVSKSWFVLPPVLEWYYKRKSATYVSLPPYRSDCISNAANPMQFIYPQNNHKIYIPLELDGRKGQVVFELAHRQAETKVYWHLDSQYLGVTQHTHKMGMVTSKGKHAVKVTDALGNEITQYFEVLSE
jgi:penicillin-binding protein 1C